MFGLGQRTSECIYYIESPEHVWNLPNHMYHSSKLSIVKYLLV